MTTTTAARRGEAMRLGLKALPTLLRIGFAEALAYRAEMLVWILTTTMPLVSMALWTTAAAGQQLGPPGERFGSAEFVTYFLLTLLVRLITSSWVLWQLTEDIRTGALSQKLLRPVHPLFFYTTEQLAALPLRGTLVMPLAVGLLVWQSRGQLTHDPRLLGAFLLSLPGAWALNFMSMAIIGLLAFYIDSALGLFYLWTGLYVLFSGYMLPLALLPGWFRTLSEVLHFRFMLDLPVRLLMGGEGGGGGLQVARLLLLEYAYVALLTLGMALLWRRGLRRFAAFGA